MAMYKSMTRSAVHYAWSCVVE